MERNGTAHIPSPRIYKRARWAAEVCLSTKSRTTVPNGKQVSRDVESEVSTDDPFVFRVLSLQLVRGKARVDRKEATQLVGSTFRFVAAGSSDNSAIVL